MRDDAIPLLLEAARRQIYVIEGNYPPTAIEPLCEFLAGIKQDINAALGRAFSASPGW